MLRFDIITIFPSFFDSFVSEGLIRRACEKKKIEVNVHNLRDFTEDKHQKVDDVAFGGGGGMVMMAEPIYQAVQKIRKPKAKTKIILFTPRGKKFSQKKAEDFSKFEQIIMICGRYEGVDERVLKYIANEGISIGNYVLMGGEIPAMVVMETTARLVRGVIGKDDFLENRKIGGGFLEYKQYTRPENIIIDGKKRKVPDVLLSGDHKKIKEFKLKQGKIIK